MIPRLIFFSILILSLKCENLKSKNINLKSTIVYKTKVYSINDLVEDTLRYSQDKNYNLFDPNGYILSYHSQIKNKMKDIYSSKSVRVYFFYVHETTDYSREFLSQTMKRIGQRMGDSNGNYFISVIFIMNKNRYLYRIGARVGTDSVKRSLSIKMDNYLRNFGSSVQNNNLGKFSVEFLDTIKSNLKDRSSDSSSSISKSRKIYSQSKLVIDTYNEIKTRYYHLFDPEEYIKKSKQDFETLKGIMNNLYRKKKIKTFIFILYGIENSYNFLPNIIHELGKRIDNNLSADNYLSILITTFRKQYFYTIGFSIDNKLIIERKIRQQLDYLTKYGITKTLNNLLYDIYKLDN